MTKGTHHRVPALSDAQRAHYREFMDIVRGVPANDVVRSMDRQTGMRWRGSSKSEMAYYYATAKKPDRLGCTFPAAARVNLTQLAKDVVGI